MGNIKTTCLRFNIDKPLHRKAWKILQSEGKSHSKLISEAIVEYRDRHSRLADDPYFESREREERFVEQIVVAVENAVKAELPTFLAACLVNISQPYNIAPAAVKPPEEAVTEANNEDIDYDFLSGA
ncbi:MAG: hypothetical protein K5979_12565 [Ruminococcus sp.]|nr:hypothetical protein [Ruminococcus sp.]